MSAGILRQASACPFCHGHGERGTYGLWFWDKGVPGRWSVACSNPDCAATGPIGQTSIEAVALWNAAPRRVGQERPAVTRVLDEAHDVRTAEADLDPRDGRQR